MNQAIPTKSSLRQRSFWLGILAAIITVVGTSTILENAVVICGRMWSTFMGTQDIWTDHMYGVGTNAWLVLLFIRVFSFTLAGFVGALVASPRSRPTLIAFVIISLGVAFFEQLPLTLSHSILWPVLWGLCAPVCTYVGFTLAGLNGRNTQSNG